MKTVKVVLFLIISFLLSVSVFAGEWEKLDEQIHSTRLKGVWCLPQKGRVIAFAEKIMVSDDGGETWKPTGRANARFSYTGMSCSVDAESSRIALFFAGHESLISLDGGEKWQKIKAINNQGLSWGTVAWKSGAPFTMITRQHHAGDAHWRSDDSGTTWTLIGQQVDLGKEQPRLAIYDRDILLRAGYDRIERSIDGGKTFSKVSDYTVNACTGVRYGDNLYWTTNQGIIVSKDKGATWDILGTPIANATWGPFFGKSEDEMVVVTEKGVHRTLDGAKTWDLLASYPDMPNAYKKAPWNEQCRFSHFAYDPQHQILYAAGLFGSLYRYEISDEDGKSDGSLK